MSSGQPPKDQFSISKLTSSTNGDSSSKLRHTATGQNPNLDPGYFAGLRQSSFGSFPFNPYPMEGHGVLGHCYYDPSSYAANYPYDDRYANPLEFHNTVRRKNATKETTSALKAWLSEHKKNPYPTKGEKIMLAILTRMTLTQVSTWFANARRRLKKENKMTWSPRTCCGKNDEECRSKKAPADSSGQHGREETDSDEDSDSDIEQTDKITNKIEQDQKEKSVKRPPEDEGGPSTSKKFKIWSIAETVSKDDKSPDSTTTTVASASTTATATSTMSPYHLVFPPWPRLPTYPHGSMSNFTLRPEFIYQTLLPFSSCSATVGQNNVTPVVEQDGKKSNLVQQLSPVSSTSSSLSSRNS